MAKLKMEKTKKEKKEKQSKSEGQEEAPAKDAEAKKVTTTLKERHADQLEQARKYVNVKQVTLAVEAVKEHCRKREEKIKARKKKLDLFEGASEVNESAKFFQVDIGVKHTPPIRKSFKLHNFPLTHPFRKLDSDIEICLIVKEKEEAEGWLKTSPVKQIRKVIGIKELRKAYVQFKHKRELAAQYDVFLCDDRVLSLMPKDLGKVFMSTSKRPLPVRLAQGNAVTGSLNARVQRSLESGYFSYAGSCSSLRAACLKWDTKDIVDNVMDCIAAAAQRVPNGWSNVQVIHVKTGNSVALPVYQSAPEVIDSEDENKSAMEVEEKEDAEEPKEEKKTKAKTPAKAPASSKKAAPKSTKKSEATPAKKRSATKEAKSTTKKAKRG